jgi:hypothetical protein
MYYLARFIETFSAIPGYLDYGQPGLLTMSMAFEFASVMELTRIRIAREI